MPPDGSVPMRMIPELAEHNRAFWTEGADGRLHVPYCDSCTRWTLPPESACPRCDGPLGSRAVSGDGSVFTFTVNEHPFNPAVPPPYVIAIVELLEQSDLRVAANIVDCEPHSVFIGMPVAVRFEHDASSGHDVYVPTFVPRMS
jgi:uncharacterized protein